MQASDPSLHQLAGSELKGLHGAMLYFRVIFFPNTERVWNFRHTCIWNISDILSRHINYLWRPTSQGKLQWCLVHETDHEPEIANFSTTESV